MRKVQRQDSVRLTSSTSMTNEHCDGDDASIASATRGCDGSRSSGGSGAGGMTGLDRQRLRWGSTLYRGSIQYGAPVTSGRLDRWILPGHITFPLAGHDVRGFPAGVISPVCPVVVSLRPRDRVLQLLQPRLTIRSGTEKHRTDLR